MYDNGSPSAGPDVAVALSIREFGGRTHAVAELDWGVDRLAGHGVSYRHPSDYLPPETGRELATARALASLAEQLLAARTHGVYATTG